MPLSKGEEAKVLQWEIILLIFPQVITIGYLVYLLRFLHHWLVKDCDTINMYSLNSNDLRVCKFITYSNYSWVDYRHWTYLLSIWRNFCLSSKIFVRFHYKNRKPFEHYAAPVSKCFLVFRFNSPFNMLSLPLNFLFYSWLWSLCLCSTFLELRNNALKISACNKNFDSLMWKRHTTSKNLIYYLQKSYIFILISYVYLFLKSL